MPHILLNEASELMNPLLGYFVEFPEKDYFYFPFLTFSVFISSVDFCPVDSKDFSPSDTY